MLIKYVFAGMIFYFAYKLTWSYVMHSSTIRMIKKYYKFKYYKMMEERQQYILESTIRNVKSSDSDICKAIALKLETRKLLNGEELTHFSAMMQEIVNDVIEKDVYPKIDPIELYKKIFRFEYYPDIVDSMMLLIKGAFTDDYRTICDEDFYNEMKSFVKQNKKKECSNERC